MNEQELQQFLEKLATGVYTNEEYQVFVDWVENCSREEYEAMLVYWEQVAEANGNYDSVDQGLIAKIEQGLDWIDEKRNAPIIPLYRGADKRRSLWPRIAAAASVLLILSAGAYLALHKKQPASNELSKNDIAPFSKQAILKTGYGKTLVLDSNRNGLLAQYAHTRIQKSGGEQIAYAYSSETVEQVVYDTLQVPAGGKPYHLKFTDGSAIIVNVASALRFPENFNGSKREAELISGEAYFTIVHNIKSPFTLRAKGQLIEDIGTEFNVNTYTDEPDSRTTLVAGAVRVNAKTLVPGQQAIITSTSLIIAAADIDQTTAWKNGYFRFNGENIQTIMRELSRWYNIEVKYDGKISTEGYYVKVSRSKNISEVLKALERTNSVYFKIEGRRVTVSSKK